MRDPSNNNAVRINNSNSNYNEENYNGARGLVRNFVYNNSNTDEENVGTTRSRVINPNNLRRMRRARMSFVNAGVARRLNFGNNGNNRPTTSNYMNNKNRMKRNANENNGTRKITWKNANVTNLPRDQIGRAHV